MAGELRLVHLKELVENLIETEENLSCLTESINRLYLEVVNVEKQLLIDSEKAQIEVLAVSLWNWAVNKKAETKEELEEKVKAYHVACKLIFIFDGSTLGEETIRRQTLMCIKTGRGWLNVGQFAMADEFLKIAEKHLEKSIARLIRKICSGQAEKVQKDNLDSDLFKVFSYQAESAIAGKDFHQAVKCIQQCKDYLRTLPQMSGYVSVLCYNFGVEAYYHSNYEESSYWLSQSQEIGQLEEDGTKKQEIQEYLYPAGLFLKLKILLALKSSDEEVKEVAFQFLDFKESINFLLSAAKLLVESGRDTVGFGFLNTLSNIFEAPENVGKAFLLYIELLLQKNELQLAKEKIENFLTVHLEIKEMPPTVLSWLHNILWDQACLKFEIKDYSEALQWYNYSLRFYTGRQMDSELAKLQRNRASCYIHLKDLDKAFEAVKEAEKYDATNPFTLFTLYKIAVLRGNTDEALKAIDSLAESLENLAAQEVVITNEENVTIDFLTLATQFALKNEQDDVSIRALEHLSQQSKDLAQVLASFKCLIRLIVPQISQVHLCEEIRKREMCRIHCFLKKVYERLDEPTAKEKLTLEMWIEEAHWFRKMAWNLAINCENSAEIIRDFFLLSYEFSQLCPSDEALLVSQKTCLLMVVAANLEVGRKTLDASEQIPILAHSLEFIEKCKAIVNVLKSEGDNSRDPTEDLLLLYEIEARAKLGDDSLPILLNIVWEMPELDTKILETVASVTMDPPAYYPDVAKKALKKALAIYLQEEPINAVRFSKCLHSYIHLSLPDGAVDLDVCPLDELRGFFEDALRVISCSEEYPQAEILWLMIKAWNTGIHEYIDGKFVIAEQWCCLGIRFLFHLDFLKRCYEVQMNDVYEEVLARMETNRDSDSNEE